MIDLLEGAGLDEGEQGVAAAMLSRVLQRDLPARPLRWLTTHTGAAGAVAVASLGRVIAREEPAHHVAALQIAGDIVAQVPAILVELICGDVHAVRFDDGRRRTRRWVPAASSSPNPEVPEGLYLISGGLGALGLMFAAHLKARQPRARIALIGRRSADQRTAACVAKLGDVAVPVQADVTDRAALERTVAGLRARFGAVRGVIHAAGILCDGLVAKLDRRDLSSVLAPKIGGARNLDAVTRGDPLEWFVLCSSLVGEVGNAGQAAYAYANAWLEGFAAERGGAGRTVSICWPYWADGGLQAGPEAIAQVRRSFGLEPLSGAAGLRAFDRALAGPGAAVLVATGDTACVSASLVDGVSDPVPALVPAGTAAPDVLAAVIAHLRAVIAAACGRSLDEVGADTAFDQLGIDLLTIFAVAERLDRDFGALPKTLFYQFTTVAELAGHLMDRHGARVAAWAGAQAPSAPPSVVAISVDAAPLPRLAPDVSHRERDIAIIGLAGRFPGADDLDGFWQQIADGNDLIREVPAERFGESFLPAALPGREGGSYARWGSFLDGIDLFDPLFFRLSPRDAALLDPQERLFLETVWHLFEDAAVDPARIKDTACGVFVGVMWGEYQLLGSRAAGAHRPSASYASIANRVSHFFDLGGPSLAVDTMCSSSLVAIHLACEAIRSGDCTLAIAGGVNLAPHPNKWKLLSQGRFAATDGRCRAFGADGDGYVPGEGVGAVLLKPLADALRDGDRLWGVIRGSAVNHGGRTNAYTVPSPRAQAAVVAAAMSRAGSAPASIGYVEAHGTGTALGDPIEVAGLAQAFGTGLDAGSVAIGSVKTNIGHLESAAGIAGLAKVLLQMRAGTIAPSLHSARPNPHIDFVATPFFVPQTCLPWRAVGEAPLRAGVSGFGAGGANAHVVVEAPPPALENTEPDGPHVVLLSARTATALERLVAGYAKFLASASPQLRLADIAFTTQVGRAGLDERLAIVAGSLGDLRDALAAAIEGRVDARLVRGSLAARGALRSLLEGDAGTTFLETLLARRDVMKLAQLWTSGHPIDWSALMPGGARRISLPAYPFDRVRCWVGAEADESGSRAVAVAGAAVGRVGLLVPGWSETSVADAAGFSGRIALIGEGDWIGLGASLGCDVVAPAEAGGLVARLGELDAVVDAGLDAALEARHEVWRALAAAASGPRLLVVRPADEDGTAGAFAGGIAAVLGGEYARVWSRELQVSAMSSAALAVAIRSELGSDDGIGRVLWRTGVRHVRTFAEIADAASGPDRLAGVGAGPVLITGGLGGLGLALARHLVSRGVRVLALAGLRPLREGDGRHAAVEQLRGSGAVVETYAGALEDAGFAEFVAGVRARHGGMRGVVHAAGRVGTGSRAYVSRDFAQVWSVASPKVDGYAALDAGAGDGRSGLCGAVFLDLGRGAVACRWLGGLRGRQCGARGAGALGLVARWPRGAGDRVGELAGIRAWGGGCGSARNAWSGGPERPGGRCVVRARADGRCAGGVGDRAFGGGAAVAVAAVAAGGGSGDTVAAGRERGAPEASCWAGCAGCLLGS